MYGLEIQAAENSVSDDQAIRSVLLGHKDSFEILMRRYNARLYRICRAILKNHDEALDVIQETYFRVFKHLNQFESRSKFSTWLCKIAIHEALARTKKGKLFESVSADLLDQQTTKHILQESGLIQIEERMLLEKAIDKLPLIYRSVLVLRDIEEFSTEQTAESLNISAEAVKTRLHRARTLLRAEVYKTVKSNKKDVYQLHLLYCDVIVSGVFARIAGDM